MARQVYLPGGGVRAHGALVLLLTCVGAHVRRQVGLSGACVRAKLTHKGLLASVAAQVNHKGAPVGRGIRADGALETLVTTFQVCLHVPLHLAHDGRRKWAVDAMQRPNAAVPGGYQLPASVRGAQF